MRKLIGLALLISALGVFAQNQNSGALAGALQESYDAEKDKDYAAAIAPLNKLGPDANTSYLVQLRLGWLYYESKDWTQSDAHYRKAVQLSPTANEPLLGLMLPQMAAGKNDEALMTAQIIARQDPGNSTALSRMAWIYFLRRDYRSAAANYHKLVALYPTDTEMLLGLGFSLKYSGETKEAAKYFQTVLLLSPNNSRALEGLKTETANAGGPPRGPGRMMQEPEQVPGHRPTH